MIYKVFHLDYYYFLKLNKIFTTGSFFSRYAANEFFHSTNIFKHVFLNAKHMRKSKEILNKLHGIGGQGFKSLVQHVSPRPA